MSLDQLSDHRGHHMIKVASIIKDNSVMRDGRIQVGDRITHINTRAIEVCKTSVSFFVIPAEARQWKDRDDHF